MARIIFLDFDGVLHPLVGEGEYVLPFEWVPLLAELLEPWPDVKVAVHSTWRYVHTDDYLVEFLGPIGDRFVAAVPRGPRAESIRWFLNANKAFSSHLILDDDAKEFDADTPSLVLCDSGRGISDHQVRERIRTWLEQTACAETAAA